MNNLHKICVALLNLPESKQAQLQLSRINVDKPVSLELSSAINPDFHWKLMETYSKGVCLVNMENKRFIQVTMNADGTFTDQFIKQFSGILDRTSINLRSLIAKFLMVTQNLADETNEFDEPIMRYTNFNDVQIYPEIPDISTSKFVIENAADGSKTRLGELTADNPLGAALLRPLSQHTRVLVNIGYYDESSETSANNFIKIFKMLVANGYISIARYTLPGTNGKQKLSETTRSISVDALDKSQSNTDVLNILTGAATKIMSTVTDVSADPTRYSPKNEIYIVYSGDSFPDHGEKLPNETDLNEISSDDMTEEQYATRQNDLKSYYKALVTDQTDPAAIDKQIQVMPAVLPGLQQLSALPISGVKAVFNDSTEHDKNTVIEYSIPKWVNGQRDTSGEHNVGFAKLYIKTKPEYRERDLVVFPKGTKLLSLYVRESPFTKAYKQAESGPQMSYDMAMIQLTQIATSYSAMLLILDKVQGWFENYTNKFANIKCTTTFFIHQGQEKVQCTMHCIPLASEIDYPFEIQFLTWNVDNQTFDTQVSFNIQVSAGKNSIQTIMLGNSSPDEQKSFFANLKKAMEQTVMHIRFGNGKDSVDVSKNQSDAFITSQSRYSEKPNDPKTVLAKSICRYILKALPKFWTDGDVSVQVGQPKSVSTPSKADKSGNTISTSIRIDNGNSGIITVMDGQNGDKAIFSFGDNDYYEIPYEVVKSETGIKYKIPGAELQKFLRWYMNVPRNMFAGKVRQAYKRDLYAGNEAPEVDHALVEKYCNELNGDIDESQREGGELLSGVADFNEYNGEDESPEPTTDEPDKDDVEENDDDTYA